MSAVMVKSRGMLRTGAQPVAGVRNTHDTVMALLMTVLMERSLGVESLELKLDLRKVKPLQLQALMVALQYEAPVAARTGALQ